MALDGTTAQDPMMQAMEVATGVRGACDDHLPVRWPAQVEVIFCPDEYDDHPFPIALCHACLVQRLEEGYRIAQLVMSDAGHPVQLGVWDQLAT